MEILYNYITADQRFKVALPVEFNLLFALPLEVKYHRDQILKYKLKVYNIKAGRASYRPLRINVDTNRVFFNDRINTAILNNSIYFLDELIKIK